MNRSKDCWMVENWRAKSWYRQSASLSNSLWYSANSSRFRMRS